MFTLKQTFLTFLMVTQSVNGQVERVPEDFNDFCPHTGFKIADGTQIKTGACSNTIQGVRISLLFDGLVYPYY